MREKADLRVRESSDREVEVLLGEGLADWQVRDAEGYCWHGTKIIDRPRGDFITFLHEVAHALVPEPGDFPGEGFHGGVWAMEFTRLVREYVNSEDNN